MPANALTVEDRTFEEFQAQASGGTVNVSGKYTITVKNGGLLPVPAGSYAAVSIKAGEVVLAEEKTASIGTISGEAEATIEFEASGPTSDSQFAQAVQAACGGNTSELDIEESVGGLLLAVTFDDTVEVKSDSPSCNLRTGGSDQGGEGRDGQGRNDQEGGNQGNRNNQDGGNQDEGDQGGQPDQPQVQELTVEGTTDPLTGLDQTYEVDDTPLDTANTFVWENSKTGETTQKTAVDNDDPEEYRTTFGSAGDFEISVTISNVQGQTVGRGSISGEVLAQTGGGNEGEDDNGGNGQDGDGEEVPDSIFDSGNYEIVNIDAEADNYEDPFVNTSQTYQLQKNGEQAPGGDFGRYDWTWEFGDFDTRDRFSINGNPSQLEYTWDETGTYRITVEIYDNEAEEATVIKSMQETVQENDGGGGFPLGNSTPSMDEAADDANDIGGF